MQSKGVMVTARIPIEVSAADIERAKVNDSYRCVVAQAIARQIKDATHIEVDSQTIRFSRQGARYIYTTPYSVMGYVVAFDAGDEIRPFKFQLRDARKIASNHKTRIGKHGDRARHRARKALPANVTPQQKKAAVTAAYSAAIEEARKLYPDEPVTITREGGVVTPRVFKHKQRSYGHRLLRINQPARHAISDEDTSDDTHSNHD